jgi:molecular chaperone IbpA
MVTSNTLSLFNENFNKLTPYAVGFDRMFDNLNRYVDNNQQAHGGFPPYNIRKEGDYNYAIEMALAGFGKKDIEIEVKDGTLAVRSTKENETDTDDNQLYRGISYRKFDRKFTLSEDIVVQEASLENGMLYIDLERIVPEEKKPRLIEVK